MASVDVVVSNPTAALVTTATNSLTAPAREVTVVTVDDTDVDMAEFVAAGCSVGPYDDGTIHERQQGGYLLHMLQVTV